jgi:hypothetical protein
VANRSGLVLGSLVYLLKWGAGVGPLAFFCVQEFAEEF